MVIDNNIINNSGSLGSARGKATPAGASAPATATTSSAEKPSQEGDSVSLSNQSQMLNRIETAIEQVPDMDTDKVEAIKAAIAEGRFAIDADSIAEKMLASDQLLGN